MTEQTDERSFAWLCKLLASFKAPFRLLETVFLHNEKVDCLIFTSPQGCAKRATVQEWDLFSLSQVLEYYNERYSQLLHCSRTPPGLCFCSLRNERFLITPELFSIITDHHFNISHSSFLQECRPSHALTQYRFQITWKAGCYWPRYFVGPVRGYSRQVLHKLVDSVKVVLTVVKQVKHRTVAELCMEFQRSDNGEFWLCDSTKCVLGRAIYPEHWRLAEESTECVSDSSSPNDTEEAPVAAPLVVVEPKELQRASTHRLSISHKRSFSQRSLGYYQSDFQELILRKYLKENKLGVELLSQPAALLKDFERKYNLDGVQSASLGRTQHTRGFSETAEKARTHLPVIRRFEEGTPVTGSGRQRKTKENSTA